ncbi:7-carboxy-7-deazaguanine synthase QueE, partial [Bacillus cereus]
MSKIPVLEIFGPTIQGEGMVIGQKTMFIRTA